MPTPSPSSFFSAAPFLSSSKAAALIRFLEHLLSLLVVCLLLLAATTWSGALLGRKIGPAESVTVAAPAPDAATLSKLGLPSERFALHPADSAAWRVWRAPDSLPQGFLVYTAPYAPETKGFAGPTPLYIHLSEEGEILAIAMAPNAETPDFLRSAEEGIFPSFIGLPAARAAQESVEAVSGATYSSLAILSNLQAALSQRYDSLQASARRAPAIGWPRTIAVLAVLLLGLLLSLGTKPRSHSRCPQGAPSPERKRKFKRLLRIILLVLNVGVLGFWCGQFLSLTLLRGWISNGLDPLLSLPALVMLLVSLLMSFLGRKKHYCAWICPFGSLQELAAMLPFPKIHLSPRAFRTLSFIRFYLLLLLLLSLWLFAGASVALDYEPFTAFLYQSATPTVISLAALFLLAGCFVPRFWCRACCPMGSLLDLSEDDRLSFATSSHKNQNQPPSHP